ncbi:MAG: hypothetical protein QOJ29_3592 [Thermoleophilaceae bacterium]|jgi:hypothetical protein|nr:hypothetical protein [Thermoleophilaceae bacterium]
MSEQRQKEHEEQDEEQAQPEHPRSRWQKYRRRYKWAISIVLWFVWPATGLIPVFAIAIHQIWNRVVVPQHQDDPIVFQRTGRAGDWELNYKPHPMAFGSAHWMGCWSFLVLVLICLAYSACR